MKSKKEFFEFQKLLFEKELDQLRVEISRFDNLSFQIKGWAITAWSALVAFGAKEKTVIVILASIPAMITFWTMDAIFKSYQRRHMARVSAIEDFLDPEKGFSGYKIQNVFNKQDFGKFPVTDLIANRTRRLNLEFDKAFRKRIGFWSTVTVSNVFYFYIFLILTSLIAAFIVFNQILP